MTHQAVGEQRVLKLRPAEPGAAIISILLSTLARPDQQVGLAVFLLEEIRVNRGSKARVIELQSEIRPAFARRLRPGRADVRAPDDDAMRRSAFTRAVWLGRDPHVARLERQSANSACKGAVRILGEGAYGGQCLSP